MNHKGIVVAAYPKSYRPSGSICQVCARRDTDCSKLDFSTMARMRVDKDGVIVVKCDQFKNDAK